LFPARLLEKWHGNLYEFKLLLPLLESWQCQLNFPTEAPNGHLVLSPQENLQIDSVLCATIRSGPSLGKFHMWAYMCGIYIYF